MASGDSSGMGWTGEGRSFVDQLIDLGLWSYLDDKTEYDISVGKGGTTYGVFRFHHYIVLESPLLPANSNRLIFELMKKPDAVGRLMVTPKVRIFSHDRKPDYKLTVKATTLRWLAELGSKVIVLLGPYNLITASCQTFSDEFLKQLGSSGYMTYVKTAAVVSGLVGVAVGIIGIAAALYYSGSSSKDKENVYDDDDDEYEEYDEYVDDDEYDE